jgi:hypothetical protein
MHGYPRRFEKEADHHEGTKDRNAGDETDD